MIDPNNLPKDEFQDRDAWELTRKKRLAELEKRRRWLLRIVEDPRNQNDPRKSFWLAEWEALDWALPILYEVVFPDGVEIEVKERLSMRPQEED